MQTERHYGNAVARTEEEQLFAWRAECLFDAGLRDVKIGKRLARSNCDLHKACDMLKAGATPRLVAKILL